MTLRNGLATHERGALIPAGGAVAVVDVAGGDIGADRCGTSREPRGSYFPLLSRQPISCLIAPLTIAHADVQSSAYAGQAIFLLAIVNANSAFSMLWVLSGFFNVVATSVWSSSSLILHISIMQSSGFGRFYCRLIIRRFVFRVPQYYQ